MSETELVTAILAALAGRHDLRAWRSNTGAALGRRGLIRFGIPGGADITGILRGGRYLAIEAKSPKGRQSPQQQRFQQMITEYGGLYILARSVQDVLNALAAEEAR